MTFVASKILWYLLSPTSLVLGLMMAALLLQWTRWRRLASRLALVASAILVALAVLPIGAFLLAPLEDRFPPPTPLPDFVHGILLLGGSTDNETSEARQQPILTSASERLFAFVDLARRYPEAKLLVSGGSGSLRPGALSEAAVTRMVLKQIGFDVARPIYEDRSRNTFDNARNAHALAGPTDGQRWLLVTSAWHMPRAIGSFRKVGWNVTAYPVDYRTTGNISWPFGRGLVGGLRRFRLASHEWIGLLVYYLLERTDAFFPAPTS